MIKKLFHVEHLKRFAILVLSFFCALSVFFCSFALPSFAASAVVPVGADLIGKLLVALGLMTATAEGYVWASNDNPYVDSIFEQQISGITSGVPVSDKTLGELYGSVIPNDVYEYDGVKFSVNGSLNELSTNDLFVYARSLVGVSYSFPTNITGVQMHTGQFAVNSKLWQTCLFKNNSVGTDLYYVPFYVLPTSSFIFPVFITFPTSNSSHCIRLLTDGSFEEEDYSFTGLSTYLCYPFEDWSRRFVTTSSLTEITGTWHEISPSYQGTDFLRVSGTGNFSFSAVTSSSCLTLSGKPVFAVVGDSTQLGDSIVQVKPPEKKDEDDKKTPPAPVSPNDWELWKTLADLKEFVSTGTVSNGGTTLSQYVNNNYNYVDVDINVPDNVNVTLGGGLDISGTGDIDITIHEDISLPSGGDGSGFFEPNAADVVSGLGKNNPVTSIIGGLFSAIDPALLGIFSVSTSLLFVLGLWKLIRG